MVLLVLGAWRLVPSAMAQADYEDYTFITLAGQAPGWFDGAAGAALFNQPFGVAADASGNVYVADTFNNTIRKVSSSGEVTTLAGLAGSPGSTDGSGQAARFNFPSGVAVDGSNNVYVADSLNHTIRKVTPGGVATTLAGMAGVPGGVDGSGGSARFNGPQSVAVDAGGNVYVADTTNCAIRKITPAGVVTTLAGKLGVSGRADASAASAARFELPYGVAVDTNGNVYVADTFNHTIRKISSKGAVTTLAGKAGSAGTNDGTLSGARFTYPCSVAVDGRGNVYVADTENDTLRQVSPAGVVTTLAGSARNAGSANGAGSGARFNQPLGVAVDGNGQVYVADSYNSTVRKVTAPGGVVTTVAGTTADAGSADGAGSAAQFKYPYGVAVDTAGTVYVSDFSNNTIRQITPAGVVTTLAGNPNSSAGTNDGTGAAATFDQPAGLAVDTNGNVYVADYVNDTIRKIAPGGVVSTLAGEPEVWGYSDGTGAAAHFHNPLGVALDAQGNVYVADTSNCLIRKITPDGTVSTLAGVANSPGPTDGPAATALFRYPQGVAVDGSNNVYVADTENATIRKITPDGVVSTLAGSARNVGASDGIGAAAQFNTPFSIAVDSQGYLYVTDTQNNTIRKISPDGTVHTLAGAIGVAGGADGSGAQALFNYPEGVAVDANGNVYATSTITDTIRKGNPVLPDMPVVEPALGPPGALRQLDVTNLTATNSWSWSIVRHPSASSAELSSATVLNPTLTPDVSDLFLVRFQGSDSLGRAAIGTLAISTNPTLPALTITQPQPSQQVTNQTFDVTGTASGALGVAAVWCQANGGPWVQAVGTLDWTTVISLTNQGQNTLSAYAVDPNGQFSATNTVLFLYAPIVVQITSPQPNQQVTNFTFTATGAASGVAGVAAVWCQLDGGPWIQAAGTSAWTTVLSLANQGQNTLSAYAVDPNGQFSDTNSVVFLYAPVVLQVSGQGTISPAYQSQSIVVGKHYTVTAKPANGCIFVDWTDNAGNIRATTAKYSFTMTTGLELEANFIPNPFLSLAGTYAGLFGDTNTFSPANAGYFSAALTGQGGLTAQLQLAGGAYRFSGPFSPYGAYSNSAVAGPGGEPLTVQLQLDLSGSQGLTGSVSSATWKAGLAAYRAAYSLTNTGPLAGKNYTLMIPEAADASTGPSGYGFGTLSVSASGGITFSITLGDGSKVTAGSSVVVGSGRWPLYLSPPAYAGKGLAWGWLSFAASSTDQTVGSLNWLKQGGLPGKLYPNGFVFSGVPVTESPYSYTNGAPLLNWTDGQGLIGLSSGLTNAVTLGANNKLTGTNKLSLTLTTASGLFQGAVPEPGSKSGISVSGVLLQGGNAGYGLFLGTSNSGSVYLGQGQ
ncbi:MAG: InlB B-repeat-containing protein [Limisphaerales bacterium]